MFWTIEDTVVGAVTLCERCALLAVNMAAFGFVKRPFGTVVEALFEINDLCASAGVPGLDGMESAEYGRCGHCEYAVQEMESA